jgi:hypothetical protein
MKKIWLLVGTLMTWPHMATAASELPFAPLPDTPDYVATVFVKLSHGPTYREVWTHHGGWTRIDERFDANAYRATTYFGPNQLFVSFAREPSAEREGYDWLHVLRGPAMAHLVRWGDSPFKAGDRRTLLGESCDIWNLSSKRLVRPDAKRLSCVTPDGIELWSRVEDDVLPGTSFEATAIERQRVDPRQVQPPRERLDLKSWLGAPGEAHRRPDAPRDVTVVMRNDATAQAEPTIQTRTVRRHYPWTYTEDVDGKGLRKLRFVNEVDRLDIRFETDPAGAPTRLSIEKALKNFDKQNWPDTGRVETILGEACNVSEHKHRHGRWSACSTADGLRLKEASRDMGERYDLVAVSLDRSPVELDAVLPPPSMFAPATWGIPE